MNLRREARWLGVIGAIVAVAVACAFYLLSNERLASPLASSYSVDAAFQSVSAVAPGLGEPVNVAGVRVGQISGVELRGGQGVLHILVDPHKLPALHEGARAVLVPNTPLKDMQVDLAPGDPRAPALPHGATIPVGRTTSPIDADQFLQALDADTRDYLKALIGDVGLGLKGRAPELRGLLRSLGPTSAQLRRVGDLLASRRHALPGLVHNLALLAQAAGNEPQVTRIVEAGNATLGALASQDAALRRSLALLPGTLGAARRTLVHAAPFARSLRRTLTALEPAVPRLGPTLRSAPGMLQSLLPLPIGPLTRFTRAVGPLGADVRPAARDLGAANPFLKRAFETINQTTDTLAYNPQGGPHGYLFWLAWFAHNADSMISTEDAHGAVWRGLGLFSCASLAPTGPEAQALQTVLKGASSCP